MNRFIFLSVIILVQFGKIKAQNESTISNFEKIYGLSLIWKESGNSFAFFDRLPSLNWDSCYRSYIPCVLNTESDWEYYLVLQNFISTLSDGHTRVYPPVRLREKYFASTNHLLRTRLIDNHIIIDEVFSDSLVRLGLVRGMEILQVENIEIHKYAQTNIAPYICASTKQNFEYQTYTLYLLNGKISVPVKITTKSPDGPVKKFSLRRKKWLRESSPYEMIPIEFNRLPENIGYLKINHFAGGVMFQKLFDSLYVELQKTNALIIDVRQNCGGASDNA